MTPRATRPRETDDEPVALAVRTYAAQEPALHAVTERYVAIITTLLDDAGINYLSVTGRTKTVASFAEKAVRRHEGRPLFTDPLTQITDVIGIRVITYVQSDVAAVADLFGDELTIMQDRDLGEETARDGRFGYASRHLLVSSSAVPERPASVQVRTVLQHAWAEFEHDIRYKGTVPAEQAPDLDRRFTLAAGLLELADREFSEIRERVQATLSARDPDFDPADPRISAQELATFLASQYPDAGWSRTDHYGWISGLLLELGIVSLAELGGLLASVDIDAVITRMGYRHPVGAVRRLDDALLSVFGERYVRLTGNAHRSTLLTTRLERLTGRPTSG
ncbi:MAG: GTP pyrophosphokinase [Jatrophihabitans sp.]|uniref:GTP pyrophosphokinase n=1 Tax=Jatrophihabitans sp. TaxID=1932789 RepID=UPI003F7F537C